MDATFFEESSKGNSRVHHVKYIQAGGIAASKSRSCQLVQRQHFLEEYLCLKEGRQVKCRSKLANLSPILIDDVIRVGGRIRRAPISFDAAHPIVLPKSHHMSVLIVRYYHHLLGRAGCKHSGVFALLNGAW